MPAAAVPENLPLLRSSGLEREFERLYQRYVADVYRYAVYVLRDGAEAEDVTQAAFLNAFRAFQRGERPHTPRSWLLTIVHNECRRHFRTKSRRPAEVQLDEGLTADHVSDDDVPTPDEIRHALGQLSFNQRSALVLRELEGRSYGEIAETLDVSVSAVETLLFRARRALREQLEGALTCGEAELALSKQLDRRLTSDETSALRAHLRACKECSRLARRQRAQRAALRSLGPLPLPGSLTSLFGGGGGAGGLLAGSGLLSCVGAAKVLTVMAGGTMLTGVGLHAAEAGILAREPAPVAPLRQAALTPGAPVQAAPAHVAFSASYALTGGSVGGRALGAPDDEAEVTPRPGQPGADTQPAPVGTAGGTVGGGGAGLLPQPQPAQLRSGATTLLTIPLPALPKPALPKPALPKPATRPLPTVPVPTVAAPKVPSVPSVPSVPNVPSVPKPPAVRPPAVSVPSMPVPSVTVPPVKVPAVPKPSLPSTPATPKPPAIAPPPVPLPTVAAPPTPKAPDPPRTPAPPKPPAVQPPPPPPVPPVSAPPPPAPPPVPTVTVPPPPPVPPVPPSLPKGP